MEDQAPNNQGKPNNHMYPLVTIAYYGPDDQTVTKIAVSIFSSPDAVPVMERWFGDHILEDIEIRAQILTFIQEHGGVHVVMTEGVIGCPHEEGIDYPLDRDCPVCPFWKGSRTE